MIWTGSKNTHDAQQFHWNWREHLEIHSTDRSLKVHPVSGCSSQYSDYKSTLSSDNTGSISASFNERLLPVNKHTMSEVGFGNK